MSLNDSQITYCKKCLYPSNHALNITFNANGVCSGCLVHEEKDQYDWPEAFERLKSLVAGYQRDKDYDCIIPVSGAKDSYFIVHFVKNVLKLKPLLVSYNRHYNTALGVQNLERLRTRLGCDIVHQTMAPSKHKTLTQQTLQQLGSIHWPYLAGATVFPVQVAVRRNIPLIIWGAHQGVDQVGMFYHQDCVEMTRRYRREHDLLGMEAEDLVDKTPELTESLLSPLFYPTDQQLARSSVRGIYLNHYLFWDSKRQHERMINQYGYTPHTVLRTFDSYNDIDCRYYMDVHDHIKYLKFGYAKVVDQTCREIRLKRLTREDGLILCNHFLKQPVKQLDACLNWLELSRESFERMLAPFRDQRVWQNRHGQWHLRQPYYEQQSSASNSLEAILRRLSFQTNNTTQVSALSQHSQLLMRGWASDFSYDKKADYV